MRTRGVRGPVGLVIASAVVVVGCGRTPRAQPVDARVQVVATTGMITDVAQRVGGVRVSVSGLMGPGVDPHLYKASAGDVRRLARADLVLYNGLHLEAAMGEVLVEMNRWRPTRAVTDSIPRSLLRSPPEYEGAYDPHVWFDVQLWERAVRAVEAALAEVDPAHASEYRSRSASYRQELRSLHDWVLARAAELPPERRVLVTAHDAFNYFGRAYGFEVMGLQGISTAAEAGTADVQRVAETIAVRRIPAVFVETSIPRRAVEALQAAVASRGFRIEIGGSLFSDAMGDAGTPEGTYAGMVRHNVNTIVDGLRGGAGPVAEVADE